MSCQCRNREYSLQKWHEHNQAQQGSSCSECPETVPVPPESDLKYRLVTPAVKTVEQPGQRQCTENAIVLATAASPPLKPTVKAAIVQTAINPP